MGKPKSERRRHSNKKIPPERVVRGKLGKPQRSKKHKKMKDVDFSAAWSSFAVGNFGRRIKNLPPESDVQEIPKTASRLRHTIHNLDPNRRNKRKKKKGKVSGSEPRVKDEVLVSKEFKFVQRKGENDRAFDNRMEGVAQRELLKAQLEEKYGVDILDVGKGEVLVKKHQSDRKREKDRERKAKKKARRRKCSEDDLEERKDVVEFGEVVHEPPTLRKKNVDVNAKPGRKNLLLKELMDTNSQISSESTHQPRSQTREVGQTVKRKFLSPVAKLRMDKARETAIQMYRNLKKANVTTANLPD